MEIVNVGAKRECDKYVFFFFQAEDGIRDLTVTGVQTCALTISKAFVMERERYDGADIAHLLHARAEALDWGRLARRFGRHWRVLLSHLILFGFIYPSERTRIPEPPMRRCLHLLEEEMRQA